MGIQDFKWILDTVPQVRERYSISCFAGKRTAVDISGFIYKFVKSMGEERWIDGMIRMLCLLKRYGIYVVCVFDGKDAPKAKENTRKERKAGVDSVKDKIQELDDIQEKIYTGYYGTNTDLPEELQKNVKYILGRQRTLKEPKKLLPSSEGTTSGGSPSSSGGWNYKDPVAMYKLLSIVKKNWDRQVLDILPEYITMVKELIDLLGFSQIQAKGEAETVCAFLWKIKVVDLVYSEDSDVLVYGVEDTISRIDFKEEKVTYISTSFLLGELNLTAEEFKDLCIMCGCDYNRRIKGYGPSKSIDLIRKHQTIENIKAALPKLDITPLNHIECRDLLRIPDMIYEKVTRPTNHQLNKQKLREYLEEYHCTIKPETIEKWWKPVTIKIIVDE